MARQKTSIMQSKRGPWCPICKQRIARGERIANTDPIKHAHCYTDSDEDQARLQAEIDTIPKGLKNYNTLGGKTPEETRERSRIFPGGVKVKRD